MFNDVAIFSFFKHSYIIISRYTCLDISRWVHACARASVAGSAHARVRADWLRLDFGRSTGRTSVVRVKKECMPRGLDQRPGWSTWLARWCLAACSLWPYVSHNIGFDWFDGDLRWRGMHACKLARNSRARGSGLYLGESREEICVSISITSLDRRCLVAKIALMCISRKKSLLINWYL